MRRPLFIAALALAAPAFAQTAPQPAAVAEAPKRFVSAHRGMFNGKRVDYVATVAETLLKDKAGTPTASVFTTAYVARNADSSRPVLFLFNGGPGSPSLWLHMGAFGPKRAPVPADVAAPIDTDAALIDNPATVLDVADIVFIDPPGTGFSRILPGANPRAFYSVTGDADAVGEVIARWLTDNGREASPRYVLGESYGTIRAAMVAHSLQRQPVPVRVDGVILMGQALNIIETSQRPLNVMSHVVSLPTLTAIAWYHERIDRAGRTLEQAIAESAAFAQGEYLAALGKGNRIGAEERDRIAARLAALTGIAAERFKANRLFILKDAFRAELLRDKGLETARYDSRYVARADPGKRAADFTDALTDLYAKRLNEHLRTTLKVTLPQEYRRRDTDLRGDWAYGSSTSPFSDWPFGTLLARTMKAQGDMRLLVGTGIYDTTTTIGAADHLVDHGEMPRDQVTVTRYAAGHMAYTDPQVLLQFTGDVRKFMLGGGSEAVVRRKNNARGGPARLGSQDYGPRYPRMK